MNIRVNTLNQVKAQHSPNCDLKANSLPIQPLKIDQDPITPAEILHSQHYSRLLASINSSHSIEGFSVNVSEEAIDIREKFDQLKEELANIKFFKKTRITLTKFFSFFSIPQRADIEGITRAAVVIFAYLT